VPSEETVTGVVVELELDSGASRTGASVEEESVGVSLEPSGGVSLEPSEGVSLEPSEGVSLEPSAGASLELSTGATGASLELPVEP
jgi:hypothetical protein